MPNETSFFKKYKKEILSIIILPLIACFFAAYLIFGDLFEAFLKMWEYRGKPNITASSVTALSYIFTILVAIYALCATTFFSKLVWNVSESNLLVTQQLQDLEKTRDKEIVRENALIVYYDLQRGISNLRDLYISYVLKGIEGKPNKIYFSAEWIKNIANLRDDLTNQELNKVYKLYEQFYALQNTLENNNMNKQDEEIRGYLEELSREVFANHIPLELMDELKAASVEEIVDIDLYIILQKIYWLTFVSSKRELEQKKVNGKYVYKTYLNGVLFFVGDNKEAFIGVGELYNTDGKIKCSGKFESKQFIEGIVYGYYSPKCKMYEIQLTTDGIKKGILYELTDSDENRYFYNGEFKDGEVFNGITTLFHYDKDISYRGEIREDYKEGQGTSYDRCGQKIFEGIWKSDLCYNGIIFKDGNEIFEGEVKVVKINYDYDELLKAWNGKATACDISSKVKEFTGEICEGKPINGEGLVLWLDEEGKTLEMLRREEEHQLEQHEVSTQEEPDIEQYEKDLEEEAKKKNDSARVMAINHSEYITAEWNEKEITLAEGKEMNIKIYDSQGNKLT
ncbi:TPA: hypothetical protein QCX14_005294 [Bacillus toyonensis]|uniref:hypothetical protein n=1 Tax=Bacillus toyonensis TaxID=155322 RepID=UPI001CF9DF56|nr:hypothetical protein [Bacillus toyonensis]